MLSILQKLPIAHDPICSTTPARGKWMLGTALATASLILTACEAPEETAQREAEQSLQREAVVTSSFEVPSPLDGLVFLPNAAAAWTGLLAGSVSGGGFDIFNIEGQVVISASGPRLDGLTGVPNFALRGDEFPILFGIDDNGALRGFIVAEQAEDVLELPLEGGFNSGLASACLFNSGVGFVDLALLGEGANAAIVRVRDLGGDGLSVETQGQFDLPYPARDCAAANGDLLIAGPAAGIARVTAQGEVLAEAEGLSIFDIAYTELLGRPVVLTAMPNTQALSIYDASSFAEIARLETTEGLSTTGFLRPTALAATFESYGGMAFSTGLVAAYDREDGEVKLVARDVVSRAVIGSADS
jgi:hypothetical protein